VAPNKTFLGVKILGLENIKAIRFWRYEIHPNKPLAHFFVKDFLIVNINYKSE
jgi:hypothetical protein